MRALTIWRPWTWAICHPGPNAKCVENRTWKAEWIRRQQIAIHAGARYDDEDAVDFIARIIGERPPTADACPQGIVAVATIGGFTHHDSFASRGWLVGPWGWELEDVRVLERPVACKGAQGLWTVPPDIEAAVRAQLQPRAA